MSKKYDETLATIKEMFPNKLLLSVDDLSQVIGLSTKTLYDRLAPNSKKKKLSIKVTRHSRYLKFRIHDVARYIASL